MKKLFWQNILFFVMLCLASLATAQNLPFVLLEDKTLARIKAFDDAWDGVLGMAAIDLTTHRMFSYHGNVLFPQASSIKIPIMIEMFRQVRAGKLKLTEVFEITDQYLVGGSGKYQEALRKGKPLRKTWQEIMEAMIIWSDNVATNVCIDRVGMANVNLTLKKLGLVQTRLQRKMIDGEAVRRNDENISTPVEMARLAQMIYEGKVIDRAACDAMIEILSKVKAGMRAAVPEAYRVAAKPGGVTAVSCETGIIFLDKRPFAVSVMSTYNGPEAGRPARAITEIVFDHFERLAHSNAYGHRTQARVEEEKR